MRLLDLFLFGSIAFGLTLGVIQAFLVHRHMRRPRARPTSRPPISILKPLYGLDDGLAENLENFATGIDYPDYELVLGLHGDGDPAWPVAVAAAARWPGRVRVVLQGTPGRYGVPRASALGLNPKINQLITLAGAARHDLLVLSDCNTRVGPGYLDEIAALLGDPSVGLVTHPAAGTGERDPGAAIDNLHMTVGIGVGTVGIKELTGKDFVVGKSMSIRRADLEALGGIGVYRNVVAEDHYLGRDVRQRLGKRVVFARQPVYCHVERRPIAGFHDRYQRWGVMQRYAVGPYVYATMIFSNPLVFACAACLVRPSGARLAVLAATAVARVALEWIAAVALRPVSLATIAWVPLKDACVFATWLHAFVSDRIRWRDRTLRVGGTDRVWGSRKDSDAVAAFDAAPAKRQEGGAS